MHKLTLPYSPERLKIYCDMSYKYEPYMKLFVNYIVVTFTGVSFLNEVLRIPHTLETTELGLLEVAY